jgi:zinc transport system substrate-binding protein
VAEADLVVHEGGFQPAVDAAVEQNATGEVLDAADVVDLEDDDPHFWQDPLRMAALGDAVAERLAGLDPDHAADYEDNAADLRADLEALDAAYRAGLADCERSTVVVSHDAFGYLAKYGLDMEPIAGLSPEAEPTPRDLARLQDLIEQQGITTVFSERLAPRQLTETLAADLGLETAVLDPLEGLDDETAGEDYLSLMEQNLAALQRANGCR